MGRGRGAGAWGMGWGGGGQPGELFPFPTLNLLESQGHTCRSPTSTYIIKETVIITVFQDIMSPFSSSREGLDLDAFLTQFHRISSALTPQTVNGGNRLKEHSAVAWLLTPCTWIAT